MASPQVLHRTRTAAVMTLAQCRALVGRPDPERAVVCRPHPWAPPGETDAGVIIGVNEVHAFVRYAGAAQPKATGAKEPAPGASSPPHSPSPPPS
jgi:hypothetical protein